MKKLFRYFLMSFAALSLASCEELENFQKTIDGVDSFIFLPERTYTALVTHTPVGSVSPFAAEFAVQCSSLHENMLTARVAVDLSLVDAYNKTYGTEYEPLPEGSLAVDNASVTIPVDAFRSGGVVKLSLAGDLGKLTSEKGYLAPVRIVATDGMSKSESADKVYVVVHTEVNNIKINSGESDFPTDALLVDRTGWTATSTAANQNNTYANLFDNSTTTYWRVRNTTTPDMTVDMGKNYTLNGIQLGVRNGSSATYSPSKIVISSSTDGTTWNEIGTATADYMYNTSSGNLRNMAMYAPVTARYLKLEMVYSNCYGWTQFSIYEKK